MQPASCMEVFSDRTGVVGDHVDGGTSRFDKQGIIYEAICANCYGMGNFPTTPGVWATQERNRCRSDAIWLP